MTVPNCRRRSGKQVMNRNPAVVEHAVLDGMLSDNLDENVNVALGR
ncbi:hypothetical protein B0G76_2627 [Paraburkholderia sp. BL23I1N1]|nr:hypothetical protein [Paraburkholderia sp. BL23I1N1]RKE36442.1 hypothetical protein B0G76_2627 [Paraburkholderia sp. BL23I1N1]